MVAAIVAAQPEIPMPKTKSKRKTASRASDSETKTRNSVRQMIARVPLKPVAKPAAHQQPQSAPQPTVSRETKRFASLECCERQVARPSSVARAAKWQPHSVRGFLAGVVRKKLGLTLVSADARMLASTGLRIARRQRWGSAMPQTRALQRRQPDCRWATRSCICAISISKACGRAGRACSGNSRRRICPAICCLPFSPTGCKPMSWAIWQATTARLLRQIAAAGGGT